MTSGVVLEASWTCLICSKKEEPDLVDGWRSWHTDGPELVSDEHSVLEEGKRRAGCKGKIKAVTDHEALPMMGHAGRRGKMGGAYVEEPGGRGGTDSLMEDRCRERPRDVPGESVSRTLGN